MAGYAHVQLQEEFNKSRPRDGIKVNAVCPGTSHSKMRLPRTETISVADSADVIGTDIISTCPKQKRHILLQATLLPCTCPVWETALLLTRMFPEERFCGMISLLSRRTMRLKMLSRKLPISLISYIVHDIEVVNQIKNPKCSANFIDLNYQLIRMRPLLGRNRRDTRAIKSNFVNGPQAKYPRTSRRVSFNI